MSQRRTNSNPAPWSPGQQQLLDSAEQTADALIKQSVHGSISGVNAGILTEYNDNDPSAGVDNKQFKGIFIRNLGYLYKHRPRVRYRAFILKNANSLTGESKCMNSSNQFGGNWSAPFDSADFVRQTAAVDLLYAANSVPPEVNYDSLRALLLASNVPLPASVKELLNGAGSLRSVMLS
jgi:hypothetical protein